MSGDRVRKALTKDGQAVVIAIDACGLVQESLERIHAWPPAMIHLGHALMASALFQALPDHANDEKLELQWRLDGRFGHLFAECRERGGVRGTILYPQADVADLNEGLGEGLLQVRRTRRGQASTGIVEARGDVTLDLLDYLERSEQKNCAMNLWVDVGWDDSRGNDQPFRIRHALGYLVHVLPQKTKQLEDATLLNWDRHLRSLGTLSKWVIGDDPTADILSFVTAEFKPQIIYDERIAFACSCSVDRAEKALALSQSLAAPDDASITPASASGEEEVQCEFCGRVYHVSAPVVE